MSTVLVVDDTRVDRRIAAGLLEEINLIVREAENGRDALQQVGEYAPDIVVTDMQMPEMDGLELVTHIRLQFPDIPVVLMTAQGSESIAVAALDRGASGYVPKSQLSDKLQETVESVLSMSQADRSFAQLMASQTRSAYTYELENNPSLVDALVNLTQQILGGMALTDHTGKFRTGVALREALMNALYRGNLEISFEEMQQAGESDDIDDLLLQRRAQPPYRDRKIHVDASINRKEARFSVRDEGSGFDYETAMENARRGLGGADTRRGRGLVLMSTFMDDISFQDGGRKVTLVKHRDVE